MYKFENVEQTSVCIPTDGVFGIRPDTWQWADYQKWLKTGGITEPFTDNDRDAIKSEIMAQFVIESRKPVEVGGLRFDGGWSSIDKLDRAIQFADKLGITERTFYETDETPHVLPIRGDGLTGESILIAIAMAYDTLDGKMRAMVKAINDGEDITISWE